jgi:hypothetical protein
MDSIRKGSVYFQILKMVAQPLLSSEREDPDDASIQRLDPNNQVNEDHSLGGDQRTLSLSSIQQVECQILIGGSA